MIRKLLLGWIGVLALVACEPANPPEPTRVEIISGDHQSAAAGGEIELPLRVRVLGPRRLDLFGRKRERQPVPGVAVHFEVDGVRDYLPDAIVEVASFDVPAGTPPPYPVLLLPEAAGAGSASEIDRENRAPARLGFTVTSDRDGIAQVNARMGTLTGNWRVEASINTKSDKVHFHLNSGVELGVPARVEAPVGDDVDLSLTLTRWDEEEGQAVAIPNREVPFRLVEIPLRANESTVLKRERRRNRTTDSDGFREGTLGIGDISGEYLVLAQVPPEPDAPRPPDPVVFTVVATDWLGVGIHCAIATILFVIGVRLLGGGFLLLTSRYSHLPTESWAANRFKGFAGGVVAGATFQSASLVTSYLTSLANSGLLQAKGALAIVLGANVGGTVLCQLLALEVDAIAAPLLVVGALLFLARRHTQWASWAWICVGFGLVFASWTILRQVASTAALSEQLRELPLLRPTTGSFTSYAGMFVSVLAAGTLTGFVFRTSNLLVVFAMVLVESSLLPPAHAIPLIIGANVGAAGMVLALAARKRREAQRTALLNFIFHLLAAALASILSIVLVDGHSPLLWLVESWVPAPLLSEFPQNATQHIATAHTLYNLIGAAVFLALPGLLIRPLERLRPSAGETQIVKPFHLDENLIAVPALALRQTTAEVVYMTEMCRKTVAEAFDAFRYDDIDLSDQVVRRGQVLADLHRETSQYLVEVGASQLTHRDAMQAEILQSAIESIARIGTYAEGLRELAARKIDEKILGSEEVIRDLGEVYDLVVAQFGNILSLLRERDIRTEENAVKMVERLAKYSSRIEAQWRQHTDAEHRDTLPLSAHSQTIVYGQAFGILFRIAADLAHIAQRMRILAPRQ